MKFTISTIIIAQLFSLKPGADEAWTDFSSQHCEFICNSLNKIFSQNFLPIPLCFQPYMNLNLGWEVLLVDREYRVECLSTQFRPLLINVIHVSAPLELPNG